MRRATLAHAGAGAAALIVGVGLTVWFAQGAASLADLKVGELAVALAMTSIGWLLAHRLPRNAIGWLLLAAGIGASYMYFGNQTDPRRIPIWFSWVASWTWMLGPTVLAVFVLLLFPNGSPLSPRWRVVGWLGGISIFLMAATSALMPFEQSGMGTDVENPIALHGAADLLEAIFIPAAAVFLASVVAAAVSLVVRYRRSGDDQRHQIKWVVYGATVSVLLYLTGGVTTQLPFVTYDLLFFASLLLFLGCVALSILRYRLYSIDRIVSRTISYTIVSATLAACYAAVVFGPTLLIGRGRNIPQASIAIATLSAAAAARPVQRRVQRAVDRRFDRSRYDAQRTVESFLTRMRTVTDLDDLQGELTSVVVGAVRPTHIALWLPDAPPVSSTRARAD
jgi:MFS family permease